MMEKGIMMRRLAGATLLIAGLAYALGYWKGYDIAQFDLPEFVHTNIFRIGYVIFTIWCLWPILRPTPSDNQINLVPDKTPSYQQSLVGSGNTNQQAQWRQGPMEHQGQIVAQAANGSWYMQNPANGEWVQYA